MEMNEVFPSPCHVQCHDMSWRVVSGALLGNDFQHVGPCDMSVATSCDNIRHVRCHDICDQTLLCTFLVTTSDTKPASVFLPRRHLAFLVTSHRMSQVLTSCMYILRPPLQNDTNDARCHAWLSYLWLHTLPPWTLKIVFTKSWNAFFLCLSFQCN
jgi:hypothetical protein